MRRPLRALLPLCLTIAACANATTPSGTDPFERVTWILDTASVEALLGEPAPDARVTIRFDGGEAGGTAACNIYGGTYTTDGGAMSIVVGSMTEMACEEPLMALEAAFVEALGSIDAFAVDGDVLTLEGGATPLRFAAEQPLPLEGTSWRLDGLAAGTDAVTSSLADTTVTAAFTDGRVEGSTGCNEYGGAYEIDGDAIAITDVAQTQIACDDEVMAQESTFIDGLLRAASFDVDGSTLILRDADGEFVLSFVA